MSNKENLIKGLAILLLSLGLCAGMGATAQAASPDSDGAAPPGRAVEPEDQVINDDLIVTGKMALGSRAVDGEVFSQYVTMKLKADNMRLLFEDTSTLSGFPTTDWQLAPNDMSSGGVNRFSIEDVTNSKVPFTIEGNSRDHTLYVDSANRVGMGTSAPAVKLHMKDGNSPSVRFEQDSSSGWIPQTWDIAGNEQNFFVRDATNGSKLPFRIQPNTPRDTLTLRQGGKVGIGTWAPTAVLHIQTSETGDIVKVTHGTTDIMDLDPSGNLTLAGTLTESSDVNAKENFEPVDGKEVLSKLEEAPVQTWNFKNDDAVRHMGTMAQDFYAAFGLGIDEKHIAPLDANGVALAAIQELNQIRKQQAEEIETLRETNSDLQERLASLEEAVEVLSKK